MKDTFLTLLGSQVLFGMDHCEGLPVIANRRISRDGGEFFELYTAEGDEHPDYIGGLCNKDYFTETVPTEAAQTAAKRAYESNVILMESLK